MHDPPFMKNNFISLFKKNFPGMASSHDFYELLGVERTASRRQIKQAYKKLALKWHPDKQTDKSTENLKKAEHMFIQISNAYQVLSNPQKRKKYDLNGFYDNNGPESSHNNDYEPSFEYFDTFKKANTFFQQTFFSTSQHFMGVPISDSLYSQDFSMSGFFDDNFPPPNRSPPSITQEDETKGRNPPTDKESPMPSYHCFRPLNPCNPSYAKDTLDFSETPGVKVTTQHINPERFMVPIHHMLNISLDDMFHGCTKTISVENKNIQISVPARSTDQSTITVPDAIKKGQRLVVILNAQPHGVFEMKGPHLYCTLDVDALDIIRGREIEVPYIKNEPPLRIPLDQVPQPISAQTEYRIPGKGLTQPGGGLGEKYGDVVIRFNIRARTLSPEQWEELIQDKNNTVKPPPQPNPTTTPSGKEEACESPEPDEDRPFSVRVTEGSSDEN